jgi:hypothetical protein
MTKYAVMVEIETGEWMYASAENPFTYNSQRIEFEDRQRAEEYAKLWRTGKVVTIHEDKNTR